MTSALRAVFLSVEQLEGLSAILLEATTAEVIDPSGLAAASALRGALNELAHVTRQSGRTRGIAILLPAEYIGIASAAVKHVISTLLPFEMPMRVHLDTAGLESLAAALASGNENQGS